MMRGIEMRERVMQCERGGGVFTFIQKGKAKLDRSKRSNEQGSKPEKFIEREVKNEKGKPRNEHIIYMQKKRTKENI